MSQREVLVRSGWTRSVGGANPYLSVHARSGASRAEMDQAVKDLQIHELPSARGCTYVVPAEDFALALKVGQGFGEEAEMAMAIKFLGVTSSEIDVLSEAVIEVLSKGQLDPRQMKAELGDKVRSLGEAGKKRGTTTTLPLALGRLQADGHIRRVPINGRLDQQRYAYTAWNPSPLSECSLTKEEALANLAEAYFRWAGPARVSEFQVFSGLGLKAAKDAVEPLGLIPVSPGSDLLLHPDQADDFHSFESPSEPRYVLVGSIDGLMHYRREVESLVDQSDLLNPSLLASGNEPANSLFEINDHAIFDRGRLVGLWQYDPGRAEIVWASFAPPDAALKMAVAEMEVWIREDLEDARSFSLDSPESRQPRLDRLRAS